MIGFWRTLRRPFCTLAPLANVTDCAFRRMVALHGKPDVIWTEFISSDGLLQSEHSYKRLEKHLKFSPIERPIVAQLFGANKDKFFEATKIVKQLGFDG